MTLPYSKKERAFFYACSYLGALFASVIILWATVLIGSNPVTFQETSLVNATGQISSEFQIGQVAGVRRHICTNEPIGLEYYPFLKDAKGMKYPLASVLLDVGADCSISTYGFIVPDLPPGDYVFQSVIRYQANLVGRDQTATAPSVNLRITR